MRGGNLNRQIVGKCSQCGGIVSVPTVYMSVDRPVPECEKCGAVADEAASLPVVPMRPVEGSCEIVSGKVGRGRRLAK